ncbi:MAG: CocE/NonD family hydrolase [Caulobacteraceae bacterium]|nr:CocE/NonD family hydrolase [Caulobacteraceae bacterium]
MVRAGKAMKQWLAGGAASLALATGAAAQPAAAPAAAPAPAAHPAGWSDQSYYLPMRDGVRLAVGLWFPGGKPPTGKAPVLLVQTRYGRAGIYGHNEDGRYEDFRKAGYVVAVVDTRGSTASFGPRDVEMGPDEIRDMDELIRHFQTRPWSNGQVIAAGVSYMADTADLATGSPSHLTGSIVRESDFDIYRDLMDPGGVANDYMMDLWGDETLKRDTGKSVVPGSSLDCAARAEDCPGLWPRLQPVDEDTDYALVRQAFAGRKRWTPADYKDADFRDDIGRNGYRLFDSSPAAHLDGIRREKTPTLYWGSWMDAGTADAAISRYRAAPGAPTQVIITANNHGGEQSTDPFFPGENPPTPTFDEQIGKMLDFSAQVRAGQPVGRLIHYYVLGAKTFRDTSSWPPAGVEMRRYGLGGDHALNAGTAAASGSDRYQVDFTATTGQTTRWSTQIGTPAAYPDRREADAKLLVYTSAPFDKDMELVGQPDVDLYMTAETKDPAVFVYLEDVAPDGRVTYLDEGQLRAIDRKIADPKALPYPLDPPQHSFNRADALPVTPGKPFEVRIALFPVAALIKQGHRVRIAIAGADADTFRRYSEGKPDVFTVYHAAGQASAVHLPLRPWK